MEAFLLRSLECLNKFNPFTQAGEPSPASPLSQIATENDQAKQSSHRPQSSLTSRSVVVSEQDHVCDKAGDRSSQQELLSKAHKSHKSHSDQFSNTATHDRDVEEGQQFQNRAAHSFYRYRSTKDSPADKINFDQFVPPEILFVILTFLDDKDLMLCSLVNRHWQSLVEHPLMYRERLDRLFINDDLSILPPPLPPLDTRGEDDLTSGSASLNAEKEEEEEQSGRMSEKEDNDMAEAKEENGGRENTADHHHSNTNINEDSEFDQEEYIDWKALYNHLRPSRWKLSKKRRGQNLEVSASGRHVRTRVWSEETNFSVQTTRALLPRRNLFYFFECTILANQRHNLAVGLADEHFKLRENFVGYASMGHNSPSWSYSSNGMVRVGLGSHGQPTVTSKYEPGDRVGFLVNFMEGRECVHFFKNGQNIGSFPLTGLLRNYKYWPTITLYSRSDEVSLCDDISCSFWKDIYPLIVEYREKSLEVLLGSTSPEVVDEEDSQYESAEDEDEELEEEEEEEGNDVDTGILGMSNVQGGEDGGIFRVIMPAWRSCAIL